MADLQLHHPRGACSIIVQDGSLLRLGELLRQAVTGDIVMLAIDSNIAATHGDVASQALRKHAFRVCTHSMIAEESRKSLDTVRDLYQAMLAARLDRSSCVVAMGGGIVGDAAGYAAATYMRGIDLIHVPTTLLAMVDAAIGGKTGVNLSLPNGSLGKNLVGAFWQPRMVVSDPQVLSTLSQRNFRCGLAECIKHGMIADASLLDFIEANATSIVSQRGPVIADLIRRSASIKVDIVQQDEREGGERALLNLGHTFAHAFESIAEFELRHGEAVAIGLIAAMHCAVHTQRMTVEQALRVTALLRQLELPTVLPMNRVASVDALLGSMGFDKKTLGGRLRLILPIGLGRACVADDVPESIVRGALLAVGAAA